MMKKVINSAVAPRLFAANARARSEEALASVINRMLSELQASHTRYYTPYEPEYYQLSDILCVKAARTNAETDAHDTEPT